MQLQQNTDRIQTTHIGSLPRPQHLLDVMKAKYSGEPYDAAAFQHGFEFLPHHTAMGAKAEA